MKKHYLSIIRSIYINNILAIKIPPVRLLLKQSDTGRAQDYVSDTHDGFKTLHISDTTPAWVNICHLNCTHLFVQYIISFSHASNNLTMRSKTKWFILKNSLTSDMVQ